MKTISSAIFYMSEWQAIFQCEEYSLCEARPYQDKQKNMIGMSTCLPGWTSTGDSFPEWSKPLVLIADKRLFCVLEREPFRERRCLEMGFPTINLARTGANIVRLRKAAGLTVHDLQAVFGFNSPQAIYKWLLVSGVHDPVLSGATNRFLSENRKPIDRIS